MKSYSLRILVPGIFAAAALALSMGAGAQTPPPPGHHPMAGHSEDMKAECQAMMAKKQEMQDKLQAMDATLDKLVAEMNAAKGSKAVDAMEQPMAAVINELVAQRKASRTLMMEMEPAMMAHMHHHMEMHGSMGAMDCPMMKKATASPAQAEEIKPKT